MSDRELMQQALELLDEATNYTSSQAFSPSMTRDIVKGVDALRERLAQPEQEPVEIRLGPLEPAPRREWVGLTEEEFELLEVKHAPPVHPDVKEDDWWDFARAIEAKLKEKNA